MLGGRECFVERDFWDLNGWSQEVHERLGERLYYYLASVRPFDPGGIRQGFRSLAKDRSLGSIRVFKLFGPLDILIRVWLHPVLEPDFVKGLQDFVVGCRVRRRFNVLEILDRWYLHRDDAAVELARSLLKSLNEARIRAAQARSSAAVLDDFVKSRLIIEREPADTLRFYITIELTELSPQNVILIRQSLINYLQDKPAIQYPSIYHGLGSFSVLFKGQVQPAEYFCIGELADHIASVFRPFDVSTETYLVHSPGRLFQNEFIGEKTFVAIRGIDLFAQSFIQEVYNPDVPKEVRQSVEQFLQGQEDLIQLLPHWCQRTIREYLRGCIDRDESQITTTLFQFFAKIERYLRNNLMAFARAYCGPDAIEQLVKDVNAKFIRVERAKEEVPEDTEDKREERIERKSLGYLLEFYSVAIRSKADASLQDVAGNWGDFVGLRNVITHNKHDFVAGWQKPLVMLIREMLRLSTLLAAIQQATGVEYQG